MQLVRVDGFEPGKPIPGLGAERRFRPVGCGLKKGEVSQPVALPATRSRSRWSTDVIPPRPSTFAEVAEPDPRH